MDAKLMVERQEMSISPAPERSRHVADGNEVPSRHVAAALGHEFVPGAHVGGFLPARPEYAIVQCLLESNSGSVLPFVRPPESGRRVLEGVVAGCTLQSRRRPRPPG